MHEQFVEPFKRFADIIIPQGGMNTVAVDMLVTKVLRGLPRAHSAAGAHDTPY